ncbi:MAG: phosphatase PAP2 family protein [Planctomycetota bacterium]|nr:phosphatase PAP2 family protein [Planctomycetota bacterium]MDA1215127.1 phosphatase PAP2 family protein [Planctomycetota bacterium]
MLWLLIAVTIGCQSTGPYHTADIHQEEMRTPAEKFVNPPQRSEAMSFTTSKQQSTVITPVSDRITSKRKSCETVVDVRLPNTAPVIPSIYTWMSPPFLRLENQTKRADDTAKFSAPISRSFPLQLVSFDDETHGIIGSDGTNQPANGELEIVDEFTFDETEIFAPTFRMQFRDDAREFLPGLWNDTRAIVNWHNGAWILGATGIALALRADADDEVREYTAEHPDRWGEGSRVLGILGEVQWQVPAILFVYGNSVWTEDIQLYDFSRTLVNAYTITGVSTIAIKGITDTDRPSDDWNNGHHGFPSFHTASSFTIAAVIEEYYGVKRAVPFYVLAGLIGWSRIDERDHDLSDVVFGAMLGYVVGKSVAAYHLQDDPRVRIRPTYSQINETYGVEFVTSY